LEGVLGEWGHHTTEKKSWTVSWKPQTTSGGGGGGDETRAKSRGRKVGGKKKVVGGVLPPLRTYTAFGKN